MKPTWISRRGLAASASSTRRQASIVGASGFSQSTGFSPAPHGRGETPWGEAGGGEQHGLHLVVADQLVAVGVDAGPDPLADLLGPLDVDVGDGHHLGVE